MVLPDTSVWVDYMRRGSRGDAASMHELLDRGEVATCGPIVAELMAGADGEVAEKMRTALTSLPWVELESTDWLEVGRAARELRRTGRKLPLTDLTIGVAAANAGHAFWTLDADFEQLRPVLPELELYRPGERGG